VDSPQFTSKKVVRKLLFILSLLILTGCASTPRLAQSDTATVITEVVRDSIVFAPADSAIIKAWFECDSLNHVIMTDLEAASGNKLTQSAIFDSGILIVKAHADSLAIYLRWKERHEKTHTTNTVERLVPVEKLVTKKPAWLMWLSGLGGGAIVFSIILIILKFKIK
jgi:hypothetical protein